MHDTFLFDLDGTLVTMELDFVKIRKEVDTILVSHGYPGELLDYTISTLETIRTAITYMQEHGLPWKETKKAADDYLEKVELEAASRAVVIKGAEEVVKMLKTGNKKVGVITRNNRRVAVHVLEKIGLTPYVDVILARDDVKKVKPHPDHVLEAVEKLQSTPEKTMVIGDHHFEIQAGNAAGCFTVGVLTGSGNRDTLKEANIIFDSIEGLKTLIEEA